jgi:hypothetical protein
MSRATVTPTELDLVSEGRRNYWVELPPSSTTVPYLIPLTVYVGSQAEPGKGVVAFGATHGNEYEGPLAIKHLVGCAMPDTACLLRQFTRAKCAAPLRRSITTPMAPSNY